MSKSLDSASDPIRSKDGKSDLSFPLMLFLRTGFLSINNGLGEWLDARFKSRENHSLSGLHIIVSRVVSSLGLVVGAV